MNSFTLRLFDFRSVCFGTIPISFWVIASGILVCVFMILIFRKLKKDSAQNERKFLQNIVNDVVESIGRKGGLDKDEASYELSQLIAGIPLRASSIISQLTRFDCRFTQTSVSQFILDVNVDYQTMDTSRTIEIRKEIERDDLPRKVRVEFLRTNCKTTVYDLLKSPGTLVEKRK